MLGIEIKRGVEATLERVFHATGNHFDKLTVVWNGKTAGVSAKKIGKGVDANVIFPSIDETKAVDKKLFNKLIGYARNQHGSFVSSLINGLEDPRIERCVYESNYAPNARALFENLTNAVLEKDGYVQPDDFKNIPFMLAIEGRRLNGYSITHPSIVDQSPYAEHLSWALKSAHKARSTAKIVEIAIELNNRLQQQAEKPQDKPQDQPNDPPQPGGDPGDPSDGDPSGQGDKPADDPADDGKKSKKSANGKGREVEPTEFINDELSQHKADCDDRRERPHVGKPVFTDVYFY